MGSLKMDGLRFDGMQQQAALAHLAGISIH